MNQIHGKCVDNCRRYPPIEGGALSLPGGDGPAGWVRADSAVISLLMGTAKIALECIECSKGEDEVAPGWQAFLVGDPDIEDDEEIVVYCPECARREFGPFGRFS